jgi:spermidine/putrescine transport system permease protein
VKGSRDAAWLALPAAGWFFFFLLVPLTIVIFYSLCTKGIYGGVVYDFTLRNYERASDPLYVRIFLSSLWLAAGTTVACLLIGFPMAYAMATAPRSWRNALLLLVVVPFWTNLVVRTYGLKVLLGELGPVNQALLAAQLIQEPIVFANRAVSVWIGMVMNYLPFMVLPLYVALDKFDFTLMEAARDLGASPRQAFMKVMVPLLKRGIASGSVFVFAPALGEFVIPDLLGGARTMLIGNLITDQFLKARDWPFGASLSLLLILGVMASLAAYLRVESRAAA